MSDTVNMILTYVPTLVFIFIVVLSICMGLARGFRKSLILGIQALVAFIAVTIFFVIIANSENTDPTLVKMVNGIAGDNFLQKTLDVSTSHTTLKDMLMEFIPKRMNLGDGLYLVAKDNGEYLRALVGLTFNLILALICCIIYLLLVFILYINYLIFYPERRHKAKVEAKYEELKTKKAYKSRRIIGGTIGLARGLVSSTIILAFFGSFLFIVAGTGKAKYNEENTVEFGDSTYSDYYNLYQSIGSYGTHGIYKILTSITDSNNFPYYLYAVDAVFSGNIKDETRGIDAKFNFAEELGAYSKFTRELFDLLAKYGDDRLVDLLLGRTDEKTIDILIEIFNEEGFEEEFDKIIDEFDAKTYFINFSLSFLDSFMAHIETININLPDDALEIMKIMFTEGYLSSYIPEEKEYIDSGITSPTRAYISPSYLLNKEDAVKTVKSLLAVISLGFDSEDLQATILMYSENFIPTLTDLTMFDERKDDFNELFGRIYEYTDNRYVQNALNQAAGTESNEVIMHLADYKELDMDYASELKYLLDTSIDAIKLYRNVYDKDEEILTSFGYMFNSQNPLREENIKYYDNVKDAIGDSKLLAKSLSSNGMYRLIENSLAKALTESYVPKGIVYENIYDSNGNLLEYGEVYNLLNGLEVIFMDDQIVDIINDVPNMGDKSTVELLDFIKAASIILNKRIDENGYAIEYVCESDLLNSVLSGVLFTYRDFGNGIELYLPDYIRKTVDDEPVNLIQNEHIVALFQDLPDLVDVVKPYLDETDPSYNKLSTIIYNEKASSIFDDIILDGTISSVAISNLTSDSMKDFIYIPAAIGTDVDCWLSIDGDGETKKLFEGIRESGFDIDKLMESTNAGDDAIEEFKKLNESQIRKLLNSSVLHYSISGYLENNKLDKIEIIIPADDRTNLTDDVLDYIIKTDSTVSLLLACKDVLPEGGYETNDIIKKLFINKKVVQNSDILGATISNYLVNSDDEISKLLTINDELKQTASKDVLISSYKTGPWKEELYDSLNAIDEILEVSIDDSIDFNDQEALEDRVYANAKKINEASITNSTTGVKRIDVCYESQIMTNTLTEKIKVGEGIIVPDEAFDYDSIYDLDEIENFNIAKTEMVYLITSSSELGLDLKNFDLTNLNINKTNYSTISKSVIIRATITEDLSTNEDIVIPTDSEESYDNGYITENELTSILEIVVNNKDVFFGVGEDDPVNVNNFIVDTKILTLNLIDQMVESDVLHATLIRKLSSGNYGFDVPYSLEVDSEVFAASYRTSNWYVNGEVKKLTESLRKINGVGVLYNDMGTLAEDDDEVITDIAIDDISVDKVLLDKENNQTVLASTVILYTIYNKVKNDIVTPDEYLIKEEDDNNVLKSSYIERNEFNYILNVISDNKYSFFDEIKDVKNAQDGYSKLITTDSVKVNVDNMTISVIEEMCNGSDVLNATVIKNIAFGDYDFVVPYTLKIEGEETKLIENYSDSQWVKNSETTVLFNSLRLLGVIDDDTKIGEIDTDTIILDKNNNAEIASSLIINATMYEKTKDQLIVPVGYYDEDKDEYNEVQTILFKETELVHILNVITDNKTSFFDSQYIDGNKVNVAHVNIDIDSIIVSNIDSMCSESNVVHATIINKISTNTTLDFKVPYELKQEGLEDNIINDYANTNWVTNNEISSLIQGLKLLGVIDETTKVSDVDTDVIVLNKDNNEEIASSSIINATMYDKIYNDLLIPNGYYIEQTDDLNVVQTTLFKEEELVHILNVITDNKTSFFDSQYIDGNKVNVAHVHVNVNTIVAANVDTMCEESDVIHATIINKISTDTTLDFTVPYTLKQEGLEDNIINDYANTNWVTNNEISSLIQGLKLLGVIDDTTTVGAINTNVIILNKNNNEEIASSSIINATMYDKIYDNLLIPNGYYDEQTDDLNVVQTTLFKEEELVHILNVITDNKTSFFDSQYIDGNKVNVEHVNIDINSVKVSAVDSMCSESDVVHATIINKIVTSTTIKLDIPYSLGITKAGSEDSLKAAFKANEWYTGSEVSKLISAVEKICNTNDSSTIGDINTEKVYFTSSADNQIIANSTIMNLTVYNKMIDSIVVPNEYLVYETNGTDVESTYLVSAEFLSLLNALTNNKSDLFEVNDDNSVNPANVNTNPDNLKISTLESLIGCNSFYATIASKITTTTNTSIVIPEEYLAQDEDYIRENYANSYWVKESELTYLFAALELIAGDGNTTVSGISPDALKNSIFNNEISTLYKSVIFNYSASNQIYNNLDSQNRPLVTAKAMDHYVLPVTGLELNSVVYIESEISLMVDALEEIGINDVNAINSGETNYNKLLLAKDIDFSIVYQSVIVADIVTQKMEDTINNPTNELTDHQSAKVNNLFNLTLSFYKETEVSTICSFLKNDLGLSDISSYNPEDISINENYATSINNSFVLRATTTAKIEESTLIIPKSSYDSTLELITKDELSKLFIAGDEGIDGDLSLSSIGAEDITPSQITNRTAINNSLIMRATISVQIHTSTGSLFIEKDRVTIDEYYDSSNKMLILNGAEINALLDYIQEQDDFDIEINFNEISYSNVAKCIDSSILRILLSSLMVTYNSPKNTQSFTITGTDTIYDNEAITLTGTNPYYYPAMAESDVYNISLINTDKPNDVTINPYYDHKSFVDSKLYAVAYTWSVKNSVY